MSHPLNNAPVVDVVNLSSPYHYQTYVAFTHAGLTTRYRTKSL